MRLLVAIATAAAVTILPAGAAGTRSSIACTISGTAGHDVLVGTGGRDVICAGGGNDVIYAGGGDDLVRAGRGNDDVYGGSGSDRIFGDAGNDRIFTADGTADVVDGGRGTDAVTADPADTLRNAERIIRRAPPPAPVTALAAGDIATCVSTSDEATAAILDLYPHALVLALGDEAYETGKADEFAQCYAPTWGRVKARTRPVPGNHEYLTSGAQPYYAYFGAAAGPRGRGYYSFNRGSWHFIALNSECAFVGGCGHGSPEERWLRRDLHRDKRFCTLVYWHEPRFSSGPHGDYFQYTPWWRDLYAAGADVVLNAHDHDYERFAPQTPSGAVNAARGIREFVVGTGGRSHYQFVKIRANSVARNDGSYGVLKLTLRSRGYSWSFLAVAGSTFTDSGSDRCH